MNNKENVSVEEKMTKTAVFSHENESNGNYKVLNNIIDNNRDGGLFGLLSHYIEEHYYDFEKDFHCCEDRCLFHCMCLPKVELCDFTVMETSNECFGDIIQINMLLEAEIDILYDYEDYGDIITKLYKVLARYNLDTLNLELIEMTCLER